MVRGEFGISYQFRQPVSHAARRAHARDPGTRLLRHAVRARRRHPDGGLLRPAAGHLARQLFLAVSLSGISLPTFLIGILLIFLFSVTLGWLPSFGRGDTVRLGWWTTGFLTASGLRALILPSVTLGLFQMTLIMRLVRAEMLEVLRTDYIRFARARGLTTRAIHLGHALKNTLVPVITIAGLQLGSVIAFSIITETVFQWPGMGLLFVQAVQNVDIPIMAAYLLLVALIFVDHQPRGRRALHRRRSAPAASSAGREAGMSDDPCRRSPRSRRRRRSARPLARFLDSDLCASFRRSKLAMVAPSP